MKNIPVITTAPDITYTCGFLLIYIIIALMIIYIVYSPIEKKKHYLYIDEPLY